MQQQHNLIVTEDSDGEIGLMIEGTQANEKIDACQIPLLIAHDCVEHMNGIEVLGTSTDEFQALGAIQYGRGFGNDLRVWGDVQNTWRYMNQNEETLLDVGEIECNEREYFQKEVNEAWRRVTMEDDCEERPNMGVKAVRLTVNLMCLGYNKAHERFGCRVSAYDAYHKVQDEFFKWMKEYSSKPFGCGPRYMPGLNLKPALGQRLRLTYTTDGQFAQLEEIHE